MRNWYIVVDLEMCRVSKGARTANFPWANEIIQIGAVLMDEKYEIVDKKAIYVSPEYGRLSTFIENLTGINKNQVLNAPELELALNELTEWLPEGNVTVVAWSENDRDQLRREIRGKSIDNARIAELFDNWIDCQKTFSEKMDYDRPYKLSEALVISGIYAEGREHDGLYDAYNTAKLFAKMETEQVLKMDPIFEKARKEVEHLNYSMGSLFKGINLQSITA